MNEMIKANEVLPGVREEANTILNSANEGASFEALLKFKKGQYFSGTDDKGNPLEVKLGTEYIAHCVGWTKCWVKFLDEGQGAKLVERRIYPVSAGKRPPDREQLDCLDRDAQGNPLPPSLQTSWRLGLDDKPADPWVYQQLIPFEDKAGEIVVFVTASVGGTRAVHDLCKAYGRRVARTGVSEQPLIKISTTMMPTKRGPIPRPIFEIIGWDGAKEGIRSFSAPDTLKEEMDDEIPF